MALEISPTAWREILAHGEKAYPEEGAGLLLGRFDGERRQVLSVIPFSNHREDAARRNRYLLSPEDYRDGELEAARLGLDVLGVFHSHPDHPERPSAFDRDWAWPWFSYLITSVQSGKQAGSRSWRLRQDRSGFDEEPVVVKETLTEG
jgi:proteasome lid subunit RPN8/RPN11